MIHNMCTVHDMTHVKQNLVAGPIVMQILYSMKGTDFYFCLTLRYSAEVFKQTQEKRKAHILIAHVPHPKHNSERFFSFDKADLIQHMSETFCSIGSCREII